MNLLVRRSALMLGGLLFGVALAAACSGGTGGQRFAFEARVAGTGAATAASHTFTNEKGWLVTLQRATVTLGPVYLNVIVPLSDSSTSLMSHFVRSAWAQSSHLGPGRVVGEVLSQVTFDALSTERV
ncbi:MAG TPA: hypothetical protein VHM25_03600, partial [Polyangiaceae bacterium]|nr:hypothetical protein [Polyangiaceae bacterium]